MRLNFLIFRVLSLFFFFIQIKEMTKELDMLLQSIEEAGGFRDACTVNQKGSVEELERGIETLNDRCKLWKVIFPTATWAKFRG